MKSVKQVFKPSVTFRHDNNNDQTHNQKAGESILGNTVHNQEHITGFHLTKGISNFLHKNVPLKGTLTRNKNKDKHGGATDANLEFSFRSALAPPLPPMEPAPRLRRFGSSTMSLNRTKKKVLTVDELYIEVLYTILHMIGCDADKEEQTILVKHLKEAFHIDNTKHEQLLDIARMREEPYLKLNLEILEARDLIGKDMAGKSDPFCTVYLSTNPMSKHYTSYKDKTLDPIWNEDFVLDVNSIETDRLRIDVWDFNPEENFSEKVKRINEIKDGRGLRKFFKEALNAGKSTCDLLGGIEISLREIPTSGLERWYPLQKPDGKSKRRRGDLKAALTLSTEKDRNLTVQEHRHLLKILFAYELQLSQAGQFSFDGSFTKESLTILAQHAVQGKLTGADTAMARWLVYSHTHRDLPLSYSVFPPILDKLKYAIEANLFLQDEENLFVEAAAVFIDHCVEFIKKHRHFIGSDDKYYPQLDNILKCLKILDDVLEDNLESDLGLCIRKDIAYRSKVPGITNGNHQEQIRSKVELAVVESIEEWYRFVEDKLPLDTTRAQRIKNLTQLAQVLHADLREGCIPLHKLFVECLEVNYMKIAYEIYEKRLVSVSREMVETTCDKLKPVIFVENSANEYVNDTLAIGTALFELYISLQNFVRLERELFSLNSFPSELRDCHVWFNNGVARWLDIALYKAMQRITKAVDIDTLEPIDDLVKHSTSAVDIKTVLVQVKTFWQQLDWPDIEAAYSFLSKILDDICKIIIFFADQMSKRVTKEHNEVNNMTKNNAGQVTPKFRVTPQLCLAINNIDFVLQFIRPFVDDLGIEEVLMKMENVIGVEVSRHCRRTLLTLVQNALENVENKILELLDMVGEKMVPDIQKFLIQGCALIAYAGRDTETLINYLDKNLIVLKERLNEKNFERILSVIWDSSAHSLSETIQISIERKKPPSYFKTLLDILKVLSNFFYGDKLPQDETLLKMKSLLQLYASDSADLISKYLWERYREQNSTNLGDFKLGSVTVRCQRLKDYLRVEILNARHLKPAEPKSAHSSEGRYLPAVRRRQRHLQSTANLSRSQRNLLWVKEKYKSLKSNLHEASIQIHASANNGLCDPYVSLRIVPVSSFADYRKYKTKVQRRTLFPLFDETFDIVLHHEPNFFRDAYLLVTVKDRGFLRNDLFLGEALLPMSEVPMSDEDINLGDLPQIQLPLTKPSNYDSDIILALNSRNFDNLAKEFLHKEKRKI